MSYDDIDNMLDELEDLEPDEREDAIQEIRDKVEQEKNDEHGLMGLMSEVFGKDD